MQSLPEMIPLPRATAVHGLSRSAIYRLAAEGKIRLVKHGARTLVDCGTVRAFLAALPTLQPRPDPSRKGAA